MNQFSFGTAHRSGAGLGVWQLRPRSPLNRSAFERMEGRDSIQTTSATGGRLAFGRRWGVNLAFKNQRHSHSEVVMGRQEVFPSHWSAPTAHGANEQRGNAARGRGEFTNISSTCSGMLTKAWTKATHRFSPTNPPPNSSKS